ISVELTTPALRATPPLRGGECIISHIFQLTTYDADDSMSPFRGGNMRRLSALILALVCLTFSESAFAQSSNATLSGTVSDAAKALIPGVTITATNTETGVVSTGVTNETGTYNLPGLLPGLYNVTGELPGFQTQTFTGVRLGNAAQVRLNFTLQVA